MKIHSPSKNFALMVLCALALFGLTQLVKAAPVRVALINSIDNENGFSAWSSDFQAPANTFIDVDYELVSCDQRANADPTTYPPKPLKILIDGTLRGYVDGALVGKPLDPTWPLCGNTFRVSVVDIPNGSHQLQIVGDLAAAANEYGSFTEEFLVDHFGTIKVNANNASNLTWGISNSTPPFTDPCLETGVPCFGNSSTPRVYSPLKIDLSAAYHLITVGARVDATNNASTCSTNLDCTLTPGGTIVWTLTPSFCTVNVHVRVNGINTDLASTAMHGGTYRVVGYNGNSINSGSISFSGADGTVYTIDSITDPVNIDVPGQQKNPYEAKLITEILPSQTCNAGSQTNFNIDYQTKPIIEVK